MKICTICKELLPFQDFSKNKSHKKDGLSPQCRKCRKKIDFRYANTENGALGILYSAIRRKIRNPRYNDFSEEEKNRHRCYMTKEQFLKKWEEHKLRYGYKCALSEENIIFKRTNHKDSVKNDGVSVDRLNPEIGYTEDNIIFVSNRVNNMKGAVTKELCVAILKAYEERNW